MDARLRGLAGAAAACAGWGALYALAVLLIKACVILGQAFVY